MADVLGEAGLLDVRVPDTVPLWLSVSGGGGCPHDDVYVGLVEEGPTFSVVHYRCRVCGEDIEKRYPHGRDGAE